MFKILKQKIRLNKIRRECQCEWRKMDFWKAELYDIEHDLCLVDKDWLIQTYGSIDAYKQRTEEYLEESKRKLNELIREEFDIMASRDS